MLLDKIEELLDMVPKRAPPRPVQHSALVNTLALVTAKVFVTIGGTLQHIVNVQIISLYALHLVTETSPLIQLPGDDSASPKHDFINVTPRRCC